MASTAPQNTAGVTSPRKYVLNMSLEEAHRRDADARGKQRDLRRNPLFVLLDGEEIRHVIKKSSVNERSVWKAKVQKRGSEEDGTWDISFLFHDLISPRLSTFAQSHYKQIRPKNTESGRTHHCNAWKECEIFRGGEWQSMEFLPLVDRVDHI